MTQNTLILDNHSDDISDRHILCSCFSLGDMKQQQQLDLWLFHFSSFIYLWRCFMYGFIFFCFTFTFLHCHVLRRQLLHSISKSSSLFSCSLSLHEFFFLASLLFLNLNLILILSTFPVFPCKSHNLLVK